MGPAAVRDDVFSTGCRLGPDAGTPAILRLLSTLKGDADPGVRFRAEGALYRLTGKW
jgi:hypothetical protein